MASPVNDDNMSADDASRTLLEGLQAMQQPGGSVVGGVAVDPSLQNDVDPSLQNADKGARGDAQHELQGSQAEVDPSLIEQLTAALQHSNAAHHYSHYEDSGGPDSGHEDQLLVDNLRSIIAGENAGARQDDSYVNDALSLARQMVEHNAQASNRVAPLISNLQLPSSLDGPTDAATLQAVQSVLQELGTGWPDDLSEQRRGKLRKRPASLTGEDRERLREENRNRKKKWRDSNSTRNKDNDLRARIHRRATLIFGAHACKQKSDWVEEEFQKRREKRILREGSEQLRHGDVRNMRGGFTHTLGSGRITELFRRSNAILSESMQRVTAGLVPEHLVRTLMVPSPSRPDFVVEYEPPGHADVWRPVDREAALYGFPPDLCRLVAASAAKTEPV